MSNTTLFDPNMPHLLRCPTAPFERPAEIIKWMVDVKQRYGLEVSGWIAVDDMPLEQMQPVLMHGHCVLTSIQRGFERHHIAQGERLLLSSTCGEKIQKSIARTVTPTETSA